MDPMDPMDVDKSITTPPPTTTTTTTTTTIHRTPASFGGTTQVFRPVSSPINMAHGTQCPFQPNAPRPSPPGAPPTFKPAVMPSCGAESPFTPIGPQQSTFGQDGLSTSTLSRSPSRTIVDHKRAAKDADMTHISGCSPRTSFKLHMSKYATIPDEIPHLTPSYPAALFGGLSPDDEHVTVWHPATGKTVAGNAAPYRRNLTQWLETHQGWEEKADELKSSKRRAAARRSKNAATNFASLCSFPVAKSLSTQALKKFNDAKVEATEKSLSEWSPEDYVRLQETLFHVGQEAHGRQRGGGGGDVRLPIDCWERICQHVGSNKRPSDVVYLAHHMLEFGIQKSMHELAAAFGGGRGSGTRAIGIPGRSESGQGLHSPGPASVGSYDGWRAPGSLGAASLPNLASGGLSAIANSFRTPKEPRITVWHPKTGKTISGNAAPCRRNLEAWMAAHPGWVPKAETQLSSARRSRAKKSRPMSVPSASGIPIAGSRVNSSPLDDRSPLFDAVQGLLDLGCSLGSYNSNSGALGSSLGKRPSDSNPGKKDANTSSVSSSGAENDSDTSDEDDDDDDDKMVM